MSRDTPIRKASPPDIGAIGDLWHEMMEFHVARDSYFELREEAMSNFKIFLAKCLDDVSYWVSVAEDKDAKVVGYCLCHINCYPPVYKRERYGEISDVCVRQSMRRLGVGALLVKEALKWFNSTGISRVECRVASLNEASNGFWRSQGFKPYMLSMYKDCL